jgi:large subunit ribosomal protein L2
MDQKIFRKIKPVTSSTRGLKLIKKPVLWSKKYIKTLVDLLPSKSGRNNTGSITLQHKGGGHKRLYRGLDFFRKDTYGIVQGLEYDPYRRAFIARVYNKDSNKFSYILAPKNLIGGSIIKSGIDADIRVGHALPLSKIPVGSLIHNVCLKEKGKAIYARAAGMYAQLIQKAKGFGRIRFRSGEQRLVPVTAVATLGVVSNENVKLIRLGKAGRSRWKGRRPSVRGVAMNPVDHPHGGGEGKTSGGRPSVTPWGKPARGPKTTRSVSKFIVVSRKKKKKFK